MNTTVVACQGGPDGEERRVVGGYLFWTAGAAVIIAATTPKILIYTVPVYAGLIIVPLALTLLLLWRPICLWWISISSAAMLVLLFYVFVLLGSVITATNTADYSATSFLLLAKRLFYHFVILVLAENGFRLLAERGSRHVDLFLRILLSLGLVPLVFSIFELVAFAVYGFVVPMHDLANLPSSSYAPTLFAVGFTGRAIGLGGLYLVGSSSIDYGILNAGLSLAALLYYGRTRRSRWFWCASLYAVGVVLSLSSTALIVLLLGLLTHFVLKGARPLRIIVVALCTIVLVVVATRLPLNRTRLFAIGDLVGTFQGVLYGTQQASNVDLRVQTFKRAFAGIDQHPRVIATGAGIDEYTARVMGADNPLIESFVIQSLINAGAIGFLALVLSFVLLGGAVRRATNVAGSIHLVADLVVRLTPGLVFSNMVSGNSVQSEFAGGLLFLLLGACSGATSGSILGSDERSVVG